MNSSQQKRLWVVIVGLVFCSSRDYRPFGRLPKLFKAENGQSVAMTPFGL